MAIISCLLADLPGEADIFGGPQKSGGDTALYKTAALCPSDVGLGQNLGASTISQMNIDFNRARCPFPDLHH